MTWMKRSSMKNIYKEHFEAYLKKKLSVIPDKFMSKKPAISEWSTYCDRLPTLSEARMWAEELEESGIAVCLGQASGIVVLDLDTENQDILNEILHLLPKSPVEKFGSKGFSRFFRYMGDNTENLKINGDVILEILSTGKKCSIPPSMHPNGSEYRWVSDKTLLDVNVAELPVLPPALISHLQMKLSQKFTDGSVDDYGRVNSGRNSTLSAKLGDLLNEVHTADTIIKDLIQFDKETNNPPYFTDANEHRTTEPITNALAFYASHMVSINYKRLRDNKEYVVPLLPSDAVEVSEEIKKPAGQVANEKLNLDLLPAPSVIKTMIDTLLQNSWVRQPQLAVGSVLATLSTLISRKFIFQGISPNLYILNVSASGCVDKDTEYYNGKQWVPISEYNGTDKVLQFDPNTNKARLVYPLDYIKKPENTFIHITNERGTLDQMLSGEHRVLTYMKAGGYKVESANIFRRRLALGINNNSNSLFKTTFKFDELEETPKYTDNQIRLQIAYCADGRDVNAEYNNIYIKKTDKKKRLEMLLETTNTTYKRYDYHTGYSKFIFNPPILTNKIPTEWATILTKKQCEIVMDEIVFWDGSIKNKGRMQYFSRHKTDIDTLQFIAARLGIRTSISEDVRKDRNTVYSCLFSREKTDLVSLGHTKKLKRVKSKDGFKYCFEVPSSFLVLRRNNRIFVTGNTGKNAGLEFVKDTFMQCSATKMLIAGDIGSDAGITDNLSSRPQCLYLMDEMGGILKSINKSGGEYTSKVADILAELFTCSNSAFLGRTLKEGVVGSCDRPNVNILGATTPTGFKEGLTRESIDKGLMGRFLIFEGDPLARSTRVHETKQLPREVLNQLNWIVSYRPQEGFSLQNREQLVTELSATPSANSRLDEIFEEFDQLRIDNIFEPSSPIVSRLYQQMIKLVIIHAVANSEQQIPKIEVKDVEFGYLIIKNYYVNISRILDENLFDNQHQRNKQALLNIIKQYAWCSKSTLIEGTSQLTKQQRNSLLDELIEAELIVQDVVQENGKLKQYFKGV